MLCDRAWDGLRVFDNDIFCVTLRSEWVKNDEAVTLFDRRWVPPVIDNEGRDGVGSDERVSLRDADLS